MGKASKIMDYAFYVTDTIADLFEQEEENYRLGLLESNPIEPDEFFTGAMLGLWMVYHAMLEENVSLLAFMQYIHNLINKYLKENEAWKRR